MNLDELADKYFQHIKKTLKLSTIRKSIDNYNLHIHPVMCFKKIYDLSTKDILEFHDYLNKKENVIKNKNSKRNSNKYNLSITFKQSIHVTLVSILNFGEKYYKLPTNVASIVGNYKKAKGSDKKSLNFLTKEEFGKFICYE